MKIIYIANIRLPTEKAHGVQIMKMCEAFSMLGHEVSLVVAKRFNKSKGDPFVYYGTKKNFSIKWLPIFDLIGFGYFGYWIETITFSISAVTYSLFKNDSVFYTRDEITAYLLTMFSKKVFWETHTKKKSYFTSGALSRVLGVVAITGASKNYYVGELKVPEEKILVAHDGVDIGSFVSDKTREKIRDEFNLPSDKKIVGYLGKYKTMGESKGVDEIVEAFAGLWNDLPETLLLIVGLNENEVPVLESVCDGNSVGVERRILLTHVEFVKIPQYLKTCDVLVMNYPGTDHYARFMSPLKLFEYMASGVPIVSSDLPSVREVLNEQNSVLVKPGDTAALSAGMKRVLVDGELSARIAKQAQVDVLGHTWEGRARQIMKFISTKQ